ncbi:hypothetical protein CDD83_1713 [Cordyceps sp. RAO-2017]|nr:hypothetical protein CDD83_1713 [Cordyceps sp. RAO-2017]
MDIPWNQAIRDDCADAFVTSIPYFTSNSGCVRYSWLRFLPRKNVPGFLGPLRDAIYQKLTSEPVLETFAGTMNTPASTIWVSPGPFLDEKGQPLTSFASTKTLYLSPKYQAWAIGPVSSLGATALDIQGFLDHLDWFISRKPHHSRQKNETWHVQLARALLSSAMTDEQKSHMKRLNIIPLRTGD